MTSTSAPKGFEGHGSKTTRERPSSIDTSNRLEICACVCTVGSLYIIPFLVVISAVATGIICALGLASVLSVSIASTALITAGCLGFAFSIALIVLGQDPKNKLNAGNILGTIAGLASLVFIVIGVLGHTHILNAFPIGLTGMINCATVLCGAAAIVCSKKRGKNL